MSNHTPLKHTIPSPSQGVGRGVGLLGEGLLCWGVGLLLPLLLILLLLLFLSNLFFGSVDIPFRSVLAILMGQGSEPTAWRYIILESRLPQAITALLSGASLAVSGLLLQTAFRNPLAGPDVFGINGGAGLAVALVMLGMGGSVAIGGSVLSGYVAVLAAAFVGAIAVTALIFFFSSFVRNNVMLLIVGIMIGFLTSSVTTLLNFFATEEGVKSYMVWGMGNFGAVSMDAMPLFASVSVVGIVLALLMMKPLNALLLGEQYAANLGINVKRTRNILLLITGLLTAVTTAFCGPIAFIGLAVPHIARLIIRTDDHRRLLPMTLLCGSAIALLCNIICTLPGDNGIIPLNAVTPLIGAPVIIYIIIRK